MILIDILDQYTSLTKDVDLFYLEIPLATSGLWLADLQTTKVPTGYKDYNIYYRGKDKNKTLQNIAYLNDAVDNMEACYIDDTKFYLERQYEWDYIGKDAEGYFVFASTLRLF